ncbi:hypothetical protein [Cereibacter johrii]|uniref:hypothetical protein n=1 Tax=Cereibacter johrii TaxID=445629 RepID=UPI0011BED756|nr:hypothetical protein [Cereibacter johrii]
MRTMVLSAFTLIMGTAAYAGCIGPIVNGGCAGAYVDNPYVGSDGSSGYDGSSGANYDYDLSNPTDRNSYSTDLDAQRRDSMSLDVGRSLDTGLGQIGGGINDDW